MPADRSAAAELFFRLHQDGILVLANAWDAGSARLMARAGAKAVATTSAGVAWSHGYADGGELPAATLTAAVAEMARVVGVPLSVDLEDGYSADPAQVGELVAAVVDAGAVGINLEDGNGSPELLCAKIEQANRAGERRGIKLFVNARVDAYLRNTVPAEQRLDESLIRAQHYRAAGASGIFVPGVIDAPTIRTLAAEIRLPLNVLARAGLPPAGELAALGVRRLSAGSGLPEAVYGRAAALAADFLRDGESAPLAAGALSYRDLNAILASR
jgi:2-methylisocitrate lyase-like PEP mutase family enzyme